MANATVDKMKALGLRHGEKAVVALAVVVCLLMFVKAFTTETIKLTPDEIKSATQQARSNIQRAATPDDVKNYLGQEKIEPVDFLAVVEARKPGGKSAEPYRLANDFASPEPGAGLLRGMPELIAPQRLLAHFGRGSSLVYATDEQGNRKYEEPDLTKPKPARPRRSGRGRGGSGSGSGSGGMMGMMMGGMPSVGGNSEAEKKKREEQERKDRERLKGSLAGSDAAKKKAAEEEPEEEPEGEQKKELKGLRWVSIVGELDHQKLRENFAKALKVSLDAANPHYLRLDLQRQELGPDGNWPGDDEWEDVDRQYSENILGNVVEAEKELVPAENRLEGLVDILPFLRSGYWRKVHLASLVPDEIKNPKKPKNTGSMGGYPGMMGSGGGGMDTAMMGGSGMMGPGMMGSGGEGDTAMMSGSGGMMGMGSGMMGSGMGGGTGGPGGPADENFPKSKAETLMIRALDFTVDRDKVYHYRVRLVVRNPNYHWETVLPGVDTSTEELPGPWSDPTGPVSVPADVTTYALRPWNPNEAQPGGMELQFRVVRWTPDDGMTVFKDYPAGPGAVIGELGSTKVPSDDLSKAIDKRVDFNSRQIVLDTMGGDRSLTKFGLGTRFDAPAMAMVVRQDGALVLRDQARDVNNGEMEEMKEIYDETMKDVESGKKKKRSSMEMMMGSGSGSGMMGGR